MKLLKYMDSRRSQNRTCRPEKYKLLTWTAAGVEGMIKRNHKPKRFKLLNLQTAAGVEVKVKRSCMPKI